MVIGWCWCRWKMVIGDLEVTRRQLCCCHSFIVTANVSFISKVRVTGGPGEIVLLSLNYFERQCVIHFKSEGHWWVFCCLPVVSASLGGCGSSS